MKYNSSIYICTVLFYCWINVALYVTKISMNISLAEIMALKLQRASCAKHISENIHTKKKYCVWFFLSSLRQIIYLEKEERR